MQRGVAACSGPSSAWPGTRPGSGRRSISEGARRCGEALLAVAGDGAVPREERVLAVSAARALAELGYVDRGRIPVGLDPSVTPGKERERAPSKAR